MISLLQDSQSAPSDGCWKRLSRGQDRPFFLEAPWLAWAIVEAFIDSYTEAQELLSARLQMQLKQIFSEDLKANDIRQMRLKSWGVNEQAQGRQISRFVHWPSRDGHVASPFMGCFARCPRSRRLGPTVSAIQRGMARHLHFKTVGRKAYFFENAATWPGRVDAGRRASRARVRTRVRKLRVLRFAS